MDRSVGLRTTDGRAARSADAPRSHSRDERRQLSTEEQPEEEGLQSVGPAPAVWRRLPLHPNRAPQSGSQGSAPAAAKRMGKTLQNEGPSGPLLLRRGGNFFGRP